MPKPGRPPKPKDQRLTVTYSFRVMGWQAKRIERTARAFGVKSAPKWIRSQVLTLSDAVAGASK